MPCAYYRHPSSAACIPAPSGCRLRLKSGIRGRSGDQGFSLFILTRGTPFGRANRRISLANLSEKSVKKSPKVCFEKCEKTPPGAHRRTGQKRTLRERDGNIPQCIRSLMGDPQLYTLHSLGPLGPFWPPRVTSINFLIKWTSGGAKVGGISTKIR